MKKLSLEVGSVSDVGKVRDINQDRIFVGKALHKSGECGMFAVADGLGGLSCGEISSSIAVELLARQWNDIQNFFSRNKFQPVSFIKNSIIDAILNSNKEILAYGIENNINLGTTISLLLIWKNQYFIGHSGDSRIYKIRGGSIEQLTQDQTWAAYQVGNNLMTWEQAAMYPNSGALNSCIGVFDNPDIFTSDGKAKQGDIFLVCSDGFYRFIKREEILGILGEAAPMQQAVLNMAGKIMQRKASDNISAILVKIL